MSNDTYQKLESSTSGQTIATAAEHEPISNVDFTLNGKQVSWTGNPNTKLLDALRDDFDLTDVKCGCREGECGACSVLLDSQLVNSCLVAMGRVAGAEIVTLAGYLSSPRYQVLDRCFAAHSAVQCGYCIPGMVMAAEALLAQNPHPSEGQVRIAISGNLCRCTGYNAIVNAILDAAKEGEGLW